MFLEFFRCLCHYYSTVGRRIRALKIPRTKESRAQAVRLIQAEVKLQKANSVLLMDSIPDILKQLSFRLGNFKPQLRTRSLLQIIINKTSNLLLKISNKLQVEFQTNPQKGKGLNLYDNAFMEVDANMYAMARKLGMLLRDISRGQTKADWKDRFNSIILEYKDEVATLDKSSFLQSSEGWLVQQLKTIRSLFREVRDKLKENGLNPNKPVPNV